MISQPNSRSSIFPNQVCLISFQQFSGITDTQHSTSQAEGSLFNVDERIDPSIFARSSSGQRRPIPLQPPPFAVQQQFQPSLDGGGRADLLPPLPSVGLDLQFAIHVAIASSFVQRFRRRRKLGDISHLRAFA
jgi:hypothetical protein